MNKEGFTGLRKSVKGGNYCVFCPNCYHFDRIITRKGELQTRRISKTFTTNNIAEFIKRIGGYALAIK